MKTEPNEPAFGIPAFADGLTKREYIASQFAIGFASAGSTGMPGPEHLAIYIIEATDALITALNKNHLE